MGSERVRRPRGSATASAVLGSAVVISCLIAARLGESRSGDALLYFYELGDIGHPGVVNVITAFGFAAGASAWCVVAAVTSQGRVRFAAAGALMFVVAFDDVLRLHNALGRADVAVHALYWVGAVALVIGLRGVLRGDAGRAELVIGLAALGISEMIDVFTPGDDLAFRFHETFSVIEETAACLGAWLLAMGSFVVACCRLQPRQRPDSGTAGSAHGRSAPGQRTATGSLPAQDRAG